MGGLRQSTVAFASSGSKRSQRNFWMGGQPAFIKEKRWASETLTTSSGTFSLASSVMSCNKSLCLSRKGWKGKTKNVVNISYGTWFITSRGSSLKYRAIFKEPKYKGKALYLALLSSKRSMINWLSGSTKMKSHTMICVAGSFLESGRITQEVGLISWTQPGATSSPLLINLGSPIFVTLMVFFLTNLAMGNGTNLRT